MYKVSVHFLHNSQVSDIEMSSAYFSWTPPSLLNGPLARYQLVSRKDGQEIIHWEGTSTEALVTNLGPYQL